MSWFWKLLLIAGMTLAVVCTDATPVAGSDDEILTSSMSPARGA